MALFIIFLFVVIFGVIAVASGQTDFSVYRTNLYLFGILMFSGLATVEHFYYLVKGNKSKLNLICLAIALIFSLAIVWHFANPILKGV